jgi:hypothetical protein
LIIDRIDDDLDATGILGHGTFEEQGATDLTGQD